MSLQERGSITLNHNSSKFHATQAHVGELPMSFEVGRIAKQASGSVWVRWGDTVVLVTACSTGKAREGIDFFPLTCEYIEKTYAAGKIPGGFFKRETRPRDAEILNARIIDRSIRPLFPKGFCHEVQVIATVISHDGIHDADAMALCGASMALHVSEIPFALEDGPIAGVRVARIDGKLIANPTILQRSECDLDVFVSSSKDAIVMVEGGAKEVSEADLIDALLFAHEQGQLVIAACQDMRAKMGKEKILYAPKAKDDKLVALVKAQALASGIEDALRVKDKKLRTDGLAVVQEKTLALVKEKMGEEAFALQAKDAGEYFSAFKKDTLRMQVLDSGIRIDGRKLDEIRPICCEVGVLPRVHGSSIFTRGETQAIVSVTLGTREDEQKIDTLQGESWRRFMLHYNFPPFSVGEVRMLRSTSRREIGHGALAERALDSMLPTEDVFPYTVRVVSEITESNGSSSMASVCGGTLALWDAGVKLRAPVAGVAMGLIKEKEKVAVLSDILGDEDHLGDMDFKVCGTREGVTAIQMDIKIAGLSREILTKALDQARQGRLHMIDKMLEALPDAREEVSLLAPRIIMMRINADKIRDVIGPGGRIIRDIIARTGAKVDINDDGTIQIAATGTASADEAVRMIEDITREAEVNRVYKGLVKRVVDFGAFIEIFPGTEGLCHVSELAPERVNQVTDVLQEGDEVNVAVLSIDRDGKIRLSRKRAIGKEPNDTID